MSAAAGRAASKAGQAVGRAATKANEAGGKKGSDNALNKFAKKDPELYVRSKEIVSQTRTDSMVDPPHNHDWRLWHGWLSLW